MLQYYFSFSNETCCPWLLLHLWSCPKWCTMSYSYILQWLASGCPHKTSSTCTLSSSLWQDQTLLLALHLVGAYRRKYLITTQLNLVAKLIHVIVYHTFIVLIYCNMCCKFLSLGNFLILHCSCNLCIYAHGLINEIQQRHLTVYPLPQNQSIE